MKVFETAADLKTFLAQERAKGNTIGFVPTMGALHEGHISLINAAKAENGVVVASIFVNPEQFNNASDLSKYPRTPEADIRLLEQNGCSAVLIPSVKEIYPEKDNTVFDLSGLDTLMEGKFRPGHFNGVVMVVKRLFEIVEPDHAYFGEKDFQQLAIIKYMTRYFKLPVTIHACATLREKSGLAMSSRNMRLSPEQREEAAAIYKALTQARENAKQYSPQEVKKRFDEAISTNKSFKPEYFEIVDSETLQPVMEWQPGRTAVGCVALWLGDVRLIDNMILL